MTVTENFSVLNASAHFTLQVSNNGVSSSVISINGVQVLGPGDFKQNVSSIQRSVNLQSSNQIAVQLRSEPGSSITVNVVGVDNDPPAISATVSPAPDNFGWNNTNVAVTFRCSDATSGIATCPAPVTLSTEGANQRISGTATDLAGNSATASLSLNIDKTPPTITASVSRAANAFGVVTAPVTVNFNCSDALSGVDTCTSPIAVTTAGLRQSFSGAVTDKAGNTASTSLTISVESAPLTVTATASPAPNAADWNNSNVTVSYTCTGGVAPVQCPPAHAVSAEDAHQVISGIATDAAGQTASATVTLNIDKTPPVISASISPAPNASGVSTTTPVTVNFTCSDTLSRIAVCPPPITVNSPGKQTFSGTAVDVAGNNSSASVTVNIQNAAPLQITASASPQPNAAGWNNTPVTVSFQCIGGVAPVQCPAPQTVTTEGQSRVISGTVTDAAGAFATASVFVNLDITPPVINVTSPASGGNVNRAQVNIQGLTLDTLSGIKGVSCNGAAATIIAGTFTCDVSLATGSNSVAIIASDVAGNSTSSPVTLIFSIPINVQITSPQALQLFSSNPITVKGTVDKPNAVVSIGGVTATLNGNGTFTASGVVLREDKNLLTASAVSPDGGIGSSTVTVFLDTQPPVVHIDTPADGVIVTTPQIDVMGNVNDMVAGTVNGDQVQVAVNGVTGAVANRSFDARGVLLVPGVNTITAIAIDRAGNTSQHQVHVTLQQFASQQTLTVISGNNQAGPISTLLPQSLVVRATDAIGRPMANMTLTFAVAKSDGMLVSGQQSGRNLTVQTDASGNASVQFQLGSRNGMGINQVAVSAPGFVGQTMFSADSTVSAATQIHTVSGEVQRGVAGLPLAEPLVAIVFDAGGNPVANIPVTFTVQSGGGLINGQTAVTQNTDGDGKASVVLVLGQQEGINNNVVTASFNGLTGQPAGFASSGVVSGQASSTTFSGIVLDDANQPIVNATASIKGTNLSAVTNASGRFTITNVPVGDLVLFVDGSTSTNAEVYPTLSFQIATVPGIDNALPGPIYLPEIDTDNSKVVGDDQDVILTMKGVPGVQYRVFAHSVTFPDGTHTGRLTLSQVHADKVPMTPPNGTAPRLVGTLQPAGVKFDPPILMTLPNADCMMPGQITELFSFHHDIEQFVTEGTAHVSADGSVVVSDPGFGLTVSGWHGVSGNSQPTACTRNCNTNHECQVSSCVNNSCQYQPLPPSEACCHFVALGGSQLDQAVQKKGAYNTALACCTPVGIVPSGISIQELVDQGAIQLGFPDTPQNPSEFCSQRTANRTHRDYNGCSIPAFAVWLLDAVNLFPGVTFRGDRNDPLGHGETVYSFTPDGPLPPPDQSFPFAERGLNGQGGFLGACDVHDECYQTCSTDPGHKAFCDLELKKIALELCAPGGAAAADNEVAACITAANSYYKGVSIFGATPYEDDQETYCDCCQLPAPPAPPQ